MAKAKRIAASPQSIVSGTKNSIDPCYERTQKKFRLFERLIEISVGWLLFAGTKNISQSESMEGVEQSLRHKLKSAKQEKLALKGLIERAADEIDNLAEADCSEEAISSAKVQAKHLRRASSPDSDQ